MNIDDLSTYFKGYYPKRTYEETLQSFGRQLENGTSRIGVIENTSRRDNLMEIEFILANEDAAKTIADLRHMIWCTTYRGIYSDEKIDNFDYEEHRQRDMQRIQDPTYHVYLITDTDNPIGYFAFQDTGTVYIQSLYIRQEYQHKGIGKQVFSMIRKYCRKQGFSQFSCNCNSHNYPAQEFYRAMGGIIIKRDEGHADKYDDQITFEFTVRE